MISTPSRRGYRFITEVVIIDETFEHKRATGVQGDGLQTARSGILESPAVESRTEGLMETTDQTDATWDTRPSIAVLPFEMRTEFNRFPALSEAIAHDISRGLSRLRWLRVFASASAFKFRGVEASIDSASRSLRARYYLTGSVETLGMV